jgi:hypothetical protein
VGDVEMAAHLRDQRLEPPSIERRVALLGLAVAVQHPLAHGGVGHVALELLELRVQVVHLARRVVQVLGERQLGPRRLLSQKAHRVGVAQRDSPLVGPVEARQDTKERGLARAVGADQANPVAVSEDERDVREERVGVVRPGNTVGFQHGPSYLSAWSLAAVRRSVRGHSQLAPRERQLARVTVL